MKEAELEKSQIFIKNDNYDESFTASGEIITFDGFLKIYLEGVDDEVDNDNTILPQVKVGEYLELNNITATERFSRSPFRYSEASLVKKMEDLGIGRPSTYAPTITTIQNRKYVEKGSSDGNERNYVKLTLHKGKIKSEMLSERFGMDKGNWFQLI